MSQHPAYGPLTAEEMQAAIDAPYGKATTMLRKHDPMWGRAPGEKLRWKARFTREVRETGVAFVEAATEKEAEELAANLDEAKIRWEVEYGSDADGELLDVEPTA